MDAVSCSSEAAVNKKLRVRRCCRRWLRLCPAQQECCTTCWSVPCSFKAASKHSQGNAKDVGERLLSTDRPARHPSAFCLHSDITPISSIKRCCIGTLTMALVSWPWREALWMAPTGHFGVGRSLRIGRLCFKPRSKHHQSERKNDGAVMAATSRWDCQCKGTAVGGPQGHGEGAIAHHQALKKHQEDSRSSL